MFPEWWNESLMVQCKTGSHSLQAKQAAFCFSVHSSMPVRVEKFVIGCASIESRFGFNLFRPLGWWWVVVYSEEWRMNFNGFFRQIGEFDLEAPRKKILELTEEDWNSEAWRKKLIRSINRRKPFHLFLTKIFVIKIPRSIQGLSNSKIRCRRHCKKLPIISIRCPLRRNKRRPMARVSLCVWSLWNCRTRELYILMGTLVSL